MEENNQKKFKGLVDTYFEKRLLEATFTNLEASENKLRLNNFAYSLRELSRHILRRLSPDASVLNCSWYLSPDPNRPDLISRYQRVAYAIQGGITDEYLKKHFDLELNNSKRDIIDSINLLSKYTHINEDVFDISDEAINAQIMEISDSFFSFFEAIQRCKKQLLDLIDDEIDIELLEHVIHETIPEVDLMSTHHYIEAINVTGIEVTNLSDEQIFFQAIGHIYVEQQFGSSTDVRNEIGGIIHTSFPFKSRLASKIALLPQIEHNLDIESFDVDVYGEPTDEEIKRMEEEHMRELGLDIDNDTIKD